MLRNLYLWCCELVWDRRLAHARTVRKGIEAEMRREVQRVQQDLEYCETRAARARMARIELRANRRLARAAS